ncbi:hypothetical protein [Rhodococcus qingshengii]|uniref:hypothetical protein n=1 Tax=Rhodococcus qingshengii TaxID=334542 RepID=UPI001BE654CF|nr:hypothetical protein [Rhodococcus qingshengii]MBT2273861.1 hypothetical protein [Rhodococcus qingshengii]
MTTTPTTFRKKPVEIQAMQWDGGYDTADALWEWTQFVVSRKEDGTPHMVATDFMVLGEDDAYEVFRCYDEDLELVPGNEIDERRKEGYSAVIRDRLHDTWVNVREGDWIIKGIQGVYPCRPDVFAATYDEVTS